VLSIAFVLAVVTSSVPKSVLYAVFSGLAHGISNSQLTPFLSNMHTALWCLTIVSIIGAAVSFARPKAAEAAPALADTPAPSPAGAETRATEARPQSRRAVA
jgi:hypothetical protein